MVPLHSFRVPVQAEARAEFGGTVDYDPDEGQKFADQLRRKGPDRCPLFHSGRQVLEHYRI
jgi:hypothetical protein